jgi:hypothetical protein
LARVPDKALQAPASKESGSRFNGASVICLQEEGTPRRLANKQSAVPGDSNVVLTKADVITMWYWIVNLAFALWIFSDARTRKMELPGLWAAGCFLLMILVVPFYLAKRPLKAGEVREGGTVWNFCKSFSILWTVLMFVVGVSGKIATSNAVQKANLDPSGSGMAFVTGFGFIMIVGVWFFVLAGVLAMGFHNRNFILEEGPTGPLKLDGDPHGT